LPETKPVTKKNNFRGPSPAFSLRKIGQNIGQQYYNNVKIVYFFGEMRYKNIGHNIGHNFRYIYVKLITTTRLYLILLFSKIVI